MAKRARSIFSVDVSGLDTALGRPAHTRIGDRIRAAIISGALTLNARLPSGRMLAKDLRVARNTVDAARGASGADGDVIRRRGAGSLVAGHLPMRDLHPRVPKRATVSKIRNVVPLLSQRAQALKVYPGHCRPISTLPFAPSLPPIDLFSRKVWNRLLSRNAAPTGSDYWEYGASKGLTVLREAIAANSAAMRATHGSPEHVIVVTSTQQAVE